MPNTFQQALQTRIIPVVAMHGVEKAHPLADALIQGGLPCAEVTLRTEAAVAVITTLAKRGDICVGAGTVLTIEQAKAARDAGAGFIVSPGFSEKVVQFCLDRSIPVVPGGCTPTEIQLALEFGIRLVKFFPAEAMGGIRTLKAVCGPFKMMMFIPTGGIHAQNLCDYLSHPCVPAIGGSWMVDAPLIAEGRFDEITRLASEAVTLAETLRAPEAI